MANGQVRCDEEPCKMKSSRHVIGQGEGIYCRPGRSRLLISERAQNIIKFRENMNCCKKNITPKEFTSLYHAQPNKGPSYAATSHNDPEAVKRNLLMSVYPPTNPTLRWRPYVETACIATDDESESPPTHVCHCNNCTSSSCVSNFNDSSVTKEVKDYIKTFCTQCTMTPRLHDVSCGSSHVIKHFCEINEGCASSPSLGIERVCIKPHQRRCSPQPILKRTYTNYNDTRCRGPSSSEDAEDAEDEAVRETDGSDVAVSTTAPKACSRSCLKAMSLSEKDSCNYKPKFINGYRKTLYNEGIFDDAIEDCYYSKGPSSCTSLKSGRFCPFFPAYIPHSHTMKSKYHEDCKKSHYGPNYVLSCKMQNPCQLRDCPFIDRRPKCKIPSVNMPALYHVSQKEDIDLREEHRCLYPGAASVVV